MPPPSEGRSDSVAPLGERIAYYRRRRGLSQVKLAGLLGRSESWVSQVERGVRPVDRISVLNEVARALSVPVTELAPDALTSADQEKEHPAVSAMRRLLTDYGLLRQEPHAEPPTSLLLLQDDLAQAWEHVHASRYGELATLLSQVVTDAEALARTGDDDTTQESLLVAAEGYQITAAMLAKLGETAMAWLAGDRAVATAQRAQATLSAVAGILRIAHAFLMGGRADEASRVAAQGVAIVEDGLSAQGPDAAPDQLSLYGALELTAAIAATRHGQSEAAREHLAQAEWAAAQLGEDRNDFHTEFGPTNVAIHAVTITVEDGDAGEALRRAAKVDAEQLSPERRARFLIDVARAHGQRREAAEALRSLRQAENLAPEQVHTHELVREMVRDLLRTRRHEPDQQLRALARRIGVIP